MCHFCGFCFRLVFLEDFFFFFKDVGYILLYLNIMTNMGIDHNFEYLNTTLLCLKLIFHCTEEDEVVVWRELWTF